MDGWCSQVLARGADAALWGCKWPPACGVQDGLLGGCLGRPARRDGRGGALSNMRLGTTEGGSGCNHVCCLGGGVNDLGVVMVVLMQAAPV